MVVVGQRVIRSELPTRGLLATPRCVPPGRRIGKGCFIGCEIDHRVERSIGSARSVRIGGLLSCKTRCPSGFAFPLNRLVRQAKNRPTLVGELNIGPTCTDTDRDHIPAAPANLNSGTFLGIILNTHAV